MKTKYFLIVGILLFGAWGCEQQTEHTATAPDGVAISYTDQGSGEPALVFVHGWSCDKGYWKNQVPAFSGKYRVVTIDYGGHGHSGTNRDHFTISSFGDDVAAVVEKLNLNPVILIGHSMGGEVIIDAASKMPGRVMALVGVDTYHQFTDTTFTEEMFDAFTAPFYSDFASSTNSFVRGMFPADADTLLVHRVAADMSMADPRVAMQAFESMHAYEREIPQKLAGMQIPVYAINADMWPTNEAYNRAMAYDFNVRYMPGYGHFVMLENAPLFNRNLQQTIDEIMKR